MSALTAPIFVVSWLTDTVDTETWLVTIFPIK